MSDAIRCFWLEPTLEARVACRRYRSPHRAEGEAPDPTPPCPSNPIGLHQAIHWFGTRQIEWVKRAGEAGYPGWWSRSLVDESEPPHDNPLWPTKCESCDYAFVDADVWQLFWETLYRRVDTGALMTLRDAPAGAMWNCDWLPESWQGGDGRSICVRTPGGDWNIDSRASNCGLPQDSVHRCWIRHGEPPDLTVDKNGVTCAAGAGSILAGSYHGFLRGGYLVTA